MTQGTVGVQDIEVMTSTSQSGFMDTLGVVLGMGGVVLITLGLLLPWMIALIQVIRRQDLKESKLLWIILLFVVGPLGVLLYAFMEQRKKLGYWSLACYVGLPILMIVGIVILAMV